ncbi:CTLH/CRA C-terminal to lish motif domain-containing protein [Phellopilus nigrolimitatus]|nr:CTLH/CRA C-terminal to lish motif domain-containing protein [Phellopilus nigrolimitatus]
MSNKVNVDGALLFEQPFARVPYEAYRKVFRTSQKYIERELGTVQTTSKELSKQARSSYDPSSALSSIDAMIGKVEGLKRKLSDLHETSGVPTQNVMRERFNHIADLESFQSRDDPSFSRWADTRIDRWLVDWALRNGKEQTARKIAEEKGVEKLVDIDLFSDIRRIENALLRHSCTEALAWCTKNTLEFDLRLQEYIELARARKNIEAIAYSKKHLVSWQDTHLHQIRQASALLAFPPSSSLFGRSTETHQRLYDPSRWESLVHAFRLAVYSLNALPTEPLLHLALYGGLASLKLPTCYNTGDPKTKNADCPVCDAQGLGTLAKEVPWSHHVNSTIVCELTGKIMDEDNPPMAFPTNGHVYSREALEDMAARNGGKVTCRRTGESCDFSALRKVFIS